MTVHVFGNLLCRFWQASLTSLEKKENKYFSGAFESLRFASFGDEAGSDKKLTFPLPEHRLGDGRKDRKVLSLKPSLRCGRGRRKTPGGEVGNDEKCDYLQKVSLEQSLNVFWERKALRLREFRSALRLECLINQMPTFALPSIAIALSCLGIHPLPDARGNLIRFAWRRPTVRPKFSLIAQRWNNCFAFHPTWQRYQTCRVQENRKHECKIIKNYFLIPLRFLFMPSRRVAAVLSSVPAL